MPLATAAGIGMSIVAGEHFFSTFLSSPWTTQKFIETEEDKKLVRKLYWLAVILSLITALVLSLILKQKWPLVAAAILCVIYIVVYEKAMNKEL